ncbi:hypothetical protein Q3G72_012899 [Acer saccharum]|nr:hypothetical protein Q3G72_012899 [Acer saccharum]
MAAKCGGGGGGDPDKCITRYADAGSCLESQRYFLSRRTVLEMLRDRGYDVSDSELALSLAEFRSIFGDKPDPERLRFYFPLRSNPTKKMLVMFLGTEQVKTERYSRNFYANCEQRKFTRVNFDLAKQSHCLCKERNG